MQTSGSAFVLNSVEEGLANVTVKGHVLNTLGSLGHTLTGHMVFVKYSFFACLLIFLTQSFKTVGNILNSGDISCRPWLCKDLDSSPLGFPHEMLLRVLVSLED